VLERMRALARDDKVWMFAAPYAVEGPRTQRFEFNVGDATMDFSPQEIRDLVEKIVAP